MLKHRVLSLIFLLQILFVRNVSGSGSCPSGWEEFDDKCYKFTGIPDGTGANCEAQCAAIGASMICVEDTDTVNFLKDHTEPGNGNGLYIGLKYVGSGFVWPAGCTSSLSRWKSNKPDGGTFVYMDDAGNWDDSDADSNHCGCEYEQTESPTRSPTPAPIPPTRNPTAKPSVAPSAAPSTKPTAAPTANPTSVAPTRVPTAGPTRAPTAGPSRAPTAAPTAMPSALPTTAPTQVPTFAPTAIIPGITDCRVTCSFLADGSVLPIVQGQHYATVQLPPHFKIEFDVNIAGLGTNSEVRNIFLLENSVTRSVLLGAGMPSSNNIRITYNDAMITQWGPSLSTPYTSTYTRVTTGYAYGHVKTVGTYTTDDLTTAFVDTADQTYNLYLSSLDYGTGFRSSGGNIKNVVITAVTTTNAPISTPTAPPTLVPTAAPTMQPSAAPTAVPTTNPTLMPSQAPTTKPTQQPSLAPTASPTTAPTQFPSRTPSRPPTAEPSIVPTAAPSASPSAQPTIMPSATPTSGPTAAPSKPPTLSPSATPTVVPTAMPTATPSTSPSTVPTAVPSANPSTNPTNSPSNSPSVVPSVAPTVIPSLTPSVPPTAVPTAMPSQSPTTAPSTMLPSAVPSAVPTAAPTAVPTCTPTLSPSASPTVAPSAGPSTSPTALPSVVPTVAPTAPPSASPSANPTRAPTKSPTTKPTGTPIAVPTQAPSVTPTRAPSPSPTLSPSAAPTATPTAKPSIVPTAGPSTTPGDPSAMPTTSSPSLVPTVEPTPNPTAAPTLSPTTDPTIEPTVTPTASPSFAPTTAPTAEPTVSPTAMPSADPTAAPSCAPSAGPTRAPTAEPTLVPSAAPTNAPSATPTVFSTAPPTVDPTTMPTVDPSETPTAVPSAAPSAAPTATPSAQPTTPPTADPTVAPSAAPTADPSALPTATPSAEPSIVPTCSPTAEPSLAPTASPSADPSVNPTADPTVSPSALPTVAPTADPSLAPTTAPTTNPSALPSADPSVDPTMAPTTVPTAEPSNVPTADPSAEPTVIPTAAPTVDPSAVPSPAPTAVPTAGPSASPSAAPSAVPTAIPTADPTAAPSVLPTAIPSNAPTVVPSADPTVVPTADPSTVPTAVPTMLPSVAPTASPSAAPTRSPTPSPSAAPTVTPTVRPSSAPIATPTCAPVANPTNAPIATPTLAPVSSLTAAPSTAPPTLPPVAPAIATLTAVTDAAAPKSRALVTVTLESGKNGIVNCGVFPESRAPTTVSDILAQRFSAASTGNSAVVSIYGLTAATTYRVYCATQTTLGTLMTLAAALSNSATVTTACCQTVSASLSAGSPLAQSVVVDALTVSLEAPPAQNLVMRFTAVSVLQGANEVLPTLFPDTMEFTSASAKTSGKVAFIAGSAGTYRVAVTLSGDSAAAYAVAFTGEATVTVLGRTDTPATPQLQSAQFNADGSAVLVTFTSATDRGGLSGSFACSRLFTFTGVGTATCQWSDASTVMVYPSNNVATNQLLSVNSDVTLNANNAIRAACNQAPLVCAAWNTVPAATVVLAAPASPTAPQVSLRLPPRVSGCASLSVDMSASTGSGGRPWPAPQFTVTEASGDPSAVSIQNQLNSGFSFSLPTIVESAALAESATYVVSVKLCNFLGACAQTSGAVVVDKNAGNVPVASIFGQQQRTITRSTALVLSATAYSESCNGTVTYKGLQRYWTVSESGVPNASLTSTSLDPTTFRLPAFRLQPLRYYDVQFTALSVLSGLSTTSSVKVYVQQGAITAVILGGSSQSVAIGSSITLDASSSRDSDVQGRTGSAAGLLFSWACVTIAPSFRATCALDTTQEGTAAPLPTTQTLRLFANNAAINTTSQVTITVTDAAGTRTQSTTVFVRTQDSSAPVVAITSTPQTLSYVNTNGQVTISGRITVQSSCTARWTVDSSVVDVTKSLTPPVNVIATGTTRPVNLVLPGGALPMRATLAFTLTCAQSAAVVTVTTNGPPQPGQFSVTPSDGTELTTPFTFAAAFWTDPNLPLSYQFGFVSTSTGVVMSLQSRSERSSGTSFLTAGPSSADYVVSTTVQVFDALNAAASASATVTVRPQENNADVGTILLAQLSASSGNTDAVKNAISLSSAVINTVSCAAAPACDGLNRAACGKVQDTCGPCLSGFVGESGDKNSPCVSAASVGTSGSACTTDAQCTGWDVCLSGNCTTPSKACATGCDVHGECIRVNINTQLRVDSCKLSDASCTAICKCDTGYSGVACSVDAAEQAQNQAVRATLINSLSDVTKADDVSQDTLATWSSSLAALTQDPYELSGSAVASVNTVATTILSGAATVSGVSYEVTAGVLDAINAAADASLRLNATGGVEGAKQTLDTIALFNQIVTSQLVSGQNSVDYVYDNFRLSALRALAARGSRVAATVPTTDLEDGNGAATTSVEVDADGGTDARESDDTEEISVNLVTTTASAYGAAGAAFHTNPLQVRVSRTSGQSSTVRFRLVHNAAGAFTNASDDASMIFNTTCPGGTETHITTYTCPITSAVLVHDCTGKRGIMTSYCPLLKPVCAILDPATGALNQNNTICVTGYYDAEVTECVCTIPLTATRRRLSDVVEQSGVLDVVSSSLYLSNNFVNTFQGAEDFNSVEDLQRVIIVIAMFATLWGCGLLIIFGCAYRQRILLGYNQKGQEALERKVQSAQMSRSPAAVRQYLADYVVEVFPSVFSNKPFFSRLYGEIARHHRYLTVLTAPPGEAGDKLRIITGAQVLTVQTMLMFLLALLYDVQGPSDDGTCPQHTDEAACLSRRSPFDSSASYCTWQATTSDGQEYQCKYQEPQFSLQVVIYIAVMVALMVALISYPVDRIFELLSAPVADDVKLALQDSATKRIGKRISAVARRASNFAMGAAAAAKDKLARTSIVGTTTRKIPPVTEAAHALAAASITVIAESSRKQQHDRQLARMRSYFASGGSRFLSQGAVDVENQSSSSDSDSNSDSDDEHDANKVGDVRAATDLSGSTATAKSGTASKERRSSSNATSTDIDAALLALAEEIRCQRRLLKPSEIEEFDEQWGMDPTGEFRTGDGQNRLLCLKGKPGARELIRKEIEFVKSETAKKVEKLNIATDKHTGLEILHLFIKDLLGRNTPAARIFETKSEEDFEHTTVVSRTAKRLAVVALVLINVFFVVFAVLTGFRRGLSWQRTFLMACIVQFVVEILLFETMECVWINCVIPALVSNEVRVVAEAIVEIVQHLCANGTIESDMFLNAPDYLFVSTNVAKKFPHLMESILVQTYVNHLPGELAKTWQEGTIARIQRHHGFSRTTLLATILVTLQYLGTAPFIFHRMFVRFLQPFVFSGLVLLWRAISTDTTYMGIAAAVVGLLLVLAVYYGYLRRRVTQFKTLNDIAPELTDGTDSAAATRKTSIVPPLKQRGSLNLAAPDSAYSSSDSLDQLARVPAGALTAAAIGVSLSHSSGSAASSEIDQDEASATVPELRKQIKLRAHKNVVGARAGNDRDDSASDTGAGDSMSEISLKSTTEPARRITGRIAGPAVSLEQKYAYASSSDGSDAKSAHSVGSDVSREAIVPKKFDQRDEDHCSVASTLTPVPAHHDAASNHSGRSRGSSHSGSESGSGSTHSRAASLNPVPGAAAAGSRTASNSASGSGSASGSAHSGSGSQRSSHSSHTNPDEARDTFP